MPPEEAAQNFVVQLLAPSPPRFAAPEPGAASSYAAIAAQTDRAGFSQPSAATEDYPAAESAKRGVPDGDLRGGKRRAVCVTPPTSDDDDGEPEEKESAHERDHDRAFSSEAPDTQEAPKPAQFATPTAKTSRAAARAAAAARLGISPDRKPTKSKPAAEKAELDCCINGLCRLNVCNNAAAVGLVDALPAA